MPINPDHLVAWVEYFQILHRIQRRMALTSKHPRDGPMGEETHPVQEQVSLSPTQF